MTKAGIMETTELYLELSDYYDHRGEAQSRDRFLVLAADAAMKAGDREEAEHLRQRLLALNPHHLLKPFASFDDALKSRDVSDYINALRRRHPAEQVAALVESTVRPNANRAAALEPTKHLQMPPPQPARAELPPAPRPVEVYRMRPTAEPPPTSIRPRPVSPPPTIPPQPSNPGRVRPVPSVQNTPHGLPPLPFQMEPARPLAPSVSPFRPQHPQMPQPSTPVYQGLRMAPTPGSWLCAILFLGLLIGGIGIAVYSLGRVFLPAEFIPARFFPSRE
jgi:hypothetical protein